MKIISIDKGSVGIKPHLLLSDFIVMTTLVKQYDDPIRLLFCRNHTLTMLTNCHTCFINNYGDSAPGFCFSLKTCLCTQPESISKKFVKRYPKIHETSSTLLVLDSIPISKYLPGWNYPKGRVIVVCTELTYNVNSHNAAHLQKTTLR